MTLRKLYIFSYIFICFELVSQTCNYSVTQNYQTKLDTDLVYKTIVFYNTKILRYDTLDLKMDIITPIGDNNSKRPIVIYFHGMNEPYKYSQVHVKRMVDVMVKERGFVLASVDYKIWAMPYVESTPANCGNLIFLLNEVYNPYDLQESVRSNYRLVQDANDAIDFVKARNVQDSSCSNLVFLSGFSAGGIVAASTTFMSDLEKPIEAGSISPINYTNIFGSALSPTLSIPRPDLGATKQSNYTTSIKGAVLFNSGMQDKSLIKQSDPSLFIYHSLNDPNVPIDSSTGACFTNSKMYGQNTLKNQALNSGYVLGQSLVLLNGNTNHDFYNTQIRPAADFINSKISLLQCQCDTNSITNLNNDNNVDFLNIYSVENNIIIKNKSSNLLQVNITLYDIMGKIMKTEFKEITATTQLSYEVVSGIYLVKISAPNFTVSKKVILLN